MKYGTTKLKVPVVVEPQIDTTIATASLTTAGEHMQTVEIVHGQSEMPAVTYRSGSSQMRPGLEKPHSNKFIPVLLPDASTDSMSMYDA
jgi:hypothetical protein